VGCGAQSTELRVSEARHSTILPWLAGEQVHVARKLGRRSLLDRTALKRYFVTRTLDRSAIVRGQRSVEVDGLLSGKNAGAAANTNARVAALTVASPAWLNWPPTNRIAPLATDTAM
jgi:hypothetical protein